MATRPRPASYRDQAAAWAVSVHDDVSAWLAALGDAGALTEHRWQRTGSGGGMTRVCAGGPLFEKASTGRSAIEGRLTPAAAARLGARIRDVARLHYFATEFWITLHPRSPLIPAVQLSLCYLELDHEGEIVDGWFNGQVELIPTFPFLDDVALFHRALRNICRVHHETLYAQLRSSGDADEGERYSGGGLSFQTLRTGDFYLQRRELQQLIDAFARVLPGAYGPIVERRRDQSYDDEARRLQLEQRGRFAAHQLRLENAGRDDPYAVLARERHQYSLPPLAAWGGGTAPEPGSAAERLQQMLEPRDWAAER